MTRTDTSTIVSMKVLIEQNVIFEVIVILHFGISVIDRSMTVFIIGKIEVKRRPTSSAACAIVFFWPDPTGHSIWKSSP